MSREPLERSGTGSRARTGAGRGARPSAGPSARPSGGGAPVEPPRSEPAAGDGGSRHAALDLVLMLVAFALCSAIAGLAGAPNLGTALTFGQIGFGLGAVYVMLRR